LVVVLVVTLAFWPATSAEVVVDEVVTPLEDEVVPVALVVASVLGVVAGAGDALGVDELLVDCA
jgi:hypothetical protein